MSSGAPPVAKVNLAEAFARVHDPWRPRIAADVNDAQVKFAKLRGEFVCHRHDAEDEIFLVVKGSLLLRFRDGHDVRLEEGAFAVVPAGVEHLPVAEEESHAVLIEPASTIHTGNVRNERTVDALERI